MNPGQTTQNPPETATAATPSSPVTPKPAPPVAAPLDPPVKGPDVVAPPEVKMVGGAPDTTIDHVLEPEVMHPRAPMTPKHVVLHREDAAPYAQNQSVVVHAGEVYGHSTADKPGDTVAHALRTGRAPAGYTIKHPKSGQPMDPDDDLYPVVSDGDKLELVKVY